MTKEAPIVVVLFGTWGWPCPLYIGGYDVWFEWFSRVQGAGPMVCMTCRHRCVWPAVTVKLGNGARLHISLQRSIDTARPLVGLAAVWSWSFPQGELEAASEANGPAAKWAQWLFEVVDHSRYQDV